MQSVDLDIRSNEMAYHLGYVIRANGGGYNPGYYSGSIGVNDIFTPYEIGDSRRRDYSRGYNDAHEDLPEKF